MIKNLADRDPAMVRLAQQVAAKLEGSASDTTVVLEDIYTGDRDPQLNDSFCHELDRLVFCCARCEYWFAQTDNANPGYMGGDWMCHECKANG